MTKQLEQRAPTSMRSLLAILAVALLVRLIHLASAIGNPMTYHLGPDEDYLIGFARSVSGPQFGFEEIYAFVDPLYGYLLGGLFAITGENQFLVYVLQILIDCGTVYLIYRLGRRLWSHRAGLVGAGAYALASTALFYTTTLLKPTLVAHYVVLWCLLTVSLWRHQNWSAWIGYGLFLGIGVALRSNLILLAFAGIALVPFSYGRECLRPPYRSAVAGNLALVGAGLVLPLLLLGARGESLTGKWSVVPPNGGVVLHQNYNVDNPESVHFVPAFVSYRHPKDIWLGYRKEADLRTQKNLTSHEVSAYWQNQATDYISSHPLQSMKNVSRKAFEFIAYKEVGNNRSISQDEAFSPMLRYLPRPYIWLMALGIPGLALMTWRNRAHATPVLFALGAILATFAVFIAAARFRFHALPLLAVGSGIFVAGIVEYWNASRGRAFAMLTSAALLALASLWIGRQMIEDPIDPMTLAWGHLKMGNSEQAQMLAISAAGQEPPVPTAHSLLGYLAQARGQHEEAVRHYRRAVALNPTSHRDRYNLALSLKEIGVFKEALAEIGAARAIQDEPEYAQLTNSLSDPLPPADQ